MSNAQNAIANPPLNEVEATTERYVPAAESRHQVLAYLSRYLFWLVMAMLLAGFSLVV